MHRRLGFIGVSPPPFLSFSGKEIRRLHTDTCAITVRSSGVGAQH